ncbi:hypothetical protein LINPERHAP1_LOCUS17865, partial [Linum perenne]
SLATKESGGISCLNSNHYCCGFLQQQRKQLVGFLNMSLQALYQSRSLDKVESNALEIYKQENDPLEKRVLEELIQREAKFKETVPSLMSTIAIESTEAQMTSVLLKRLDHRKGQLTCFKEKVYRLEEEELKL